MLAIGWHGDVFHLDELPGRIGIRVDAELLGQFLVGLERGMAAPFGFRLLQKYFLLRSHF